jgi:phosphoribosyl-ATP pyrophosphohydrolase
MINIIYPIDPRIINKCADKMNINSHKGNSWMDAQLTPLTFLQNKLSEEYAEFVLAIHSLGRADIESEGADLINIISMIIRRYRI